MKTRIIALSKIDKMSKQLDMIKGLSRNLLQLSVYKATLETAGKGSVFYCNQPDVPSVNVVIYDLGFSTNKTFNEYLKKIKISDEDLKLNVTQSICAGFDINENELHKGKYDEAFNASVFGSFIKAKYGSNEIASSNDIKNEGIVRDRFWLLYRGLKKWVETTDAFNKVCDCLSNACACGSIKCDRCENCPQLSECLQQNIIKKSIEELDNIFKDPFIECTAFLDRCDLNIQDSGCQDSDCQAGGLDTTCFVCDLERKSDLCESGLLYGLAGAQSSYSCVISKKTITLSGGIVFVCTDTKYAIPSDSGQSFLTYRIKAYFSFKKSGLCPNTYTGPVMPSSYCYCTVIPLPIPPPAPGPAPQPPPPPV
jgi:hypothetical protein